MSFPTAAETRLGRVREYPMDLAIVSLAAALAFLLITSVPAESPLRLLVAFPLALFLPGYALTSFLFPAVERAARETAATTVEQRPRGSTPSNDWGSRSSCRSRCCHLSSLRFR